MTSSVVAARPVRPVKQGVRLALLRRFGGQTPTGASRGWTAIDPHEREAENGWSNDASRTMRLQRTSRGARKKNRRYGIGVKWPRPAARTVKRRVSIF